MPPQTLKAVAEDIYARLVQDGCQARDIVNLSTELIALVTSELAREGELTD